MAKRTLENIYSRVAAATVAVGPPQRRGQGVYVGNGYIITAAHCLKYDNNTGIRIALGEHVLYKVETAQGERFYVSPLVIESCSDIAMLGPLDNQNFPEDMTDGYEAFCDRTKPVPLCRRRISVFPAEFGIHIRTHEKTWATGKATVFQDGWAGAWVKTDEPIKGGTSGGPIINDAGELVGVVSWTSEPHGEEKCDGHHPAPRWALPAWIFHRICGREA